MRLYTKPRHGTTPPRNQFPETLRVRSSSRGGTSTAVYVVAAGVATLIHRTEPRGVLRARAFRWGREAGRG
jgi:hypothetical protein